MLRTLFLALLFPAVAYAQSPQVHLEALEIPGIPGLQSFAWAEHDEYWLLIGGRTDGLHRRQPWASFLAEGNNTSLFVVRPSTGEVWSTGVDQLPAYQAEQLQSTNLCFYQSGETLYIAGGYGYSATADDHITHPYLTAVDVPSVIAHIQEGASISGDIYSVEDDRMAITGGQLGKIGDRYYLVCGQRFTGRYNPNNGPSFVQEYSNQVRSFNIADDGSALSIAAYESVTDEVNLHRRDYNMVAQVFPEGSTGYTVFSGVFQIAADLPYLNTVDLSTSGYAVNDSFNQYLNQYHTAHLPLWSEQDNEMHTLFFGGISQYSLDKEGNLVSDENVPFVQHISRVTRSADGSMNEYQLEESMPGWIGASAEFIPAPGLPFEENGILRLDEVSGDSVLVGYIVGGINSSAANIFFDNDGTQSAASPTVFAVYLLQGSGNEVPVVDASSVADLAVTAFPNPTSSVVSIQFTLHEPAIAELLLQDVNGRLLDHQTTQKMGPGDYEIEMDLSERPEGIYAVTLSTGRYMRTVRVKKTK